MSERHYTLWIVIAAGALTILIFGLSLLPHGQRNVTPLENIHGIPFPSQNNAQVITEELAHADVLLNEPVLAKNLTLTMTFRPGNLERLGVGVRENEFWLSYTPIMLYPNPHLTQTVTIPLTDKLQEKDRSLDLMFFAEAKNNSPRWELVNLTASTEQAIPTTTQLKDYLRSIIYKERAL